MESLGKQLKQYVNVMPTQLSSYMPRDADVGVIVCTTGRFMMLMLASL